MGLGTSWWPLQACSIPGRGSQSPGRGAKLLVLKKAALTAGQQAPAPAGAPGTAGTARNGSTAGPGAPYSPSSPSLQTAPGPFPPGEESAPRFSSLLVLYKQPAFITGSVEVQSLYVKKQPEDTVGCLKPLEKGRWEGGRRVTPWGSTEGITKGIKRGLCRD